MDGLLYFVLPLSGIVTGFVLRVFIAKIHLRSAEEKAKLVLEHAEKDAENTRREAVLETKDALLEEKHKIELETRERRAELSKQEQRLVQKEENLDKRIETIDKREEQSKKVELQVAEKLVDIEKDKKKYQTELEKLSGLSAEEARSMLIKDFEDEAKYRAAKFIRKIEEDAKDEADRKARDIVADTIQRCVPEVVGEVSVSTVVLPNDEMKGRIIGREGRNIRALEVITGVDVIIDDTPESVVISCFDPVRRQIAKQSLEKLIIDGRIHPAMIEKIVGQMTRNIEKIIIEEGEQAVFELGLHRMSPELVRALGRLKYRTSYGQNVLNHSKTVANLSGLIAGELGANVQLAIRGGLLHDIGKGISREGAGGHALVGADMAKQSGESDAVINMIASHHGDREPSCVESVIVAAADAISAARPGARKESLDNYIQRLENLEIIASSFKGVEKAFAIQAGRELRIMVKNDMINENQAKELARDVAKKIEDELKHKYPGQVKVTVIRETRVTEYAT